MTELVWRETDGTYASEGYRIARGTGCEWILEIDPQRRPAFARAARWSDGRFSSLRSARAAALHLEIARVRRLKGARHVTLALVFASVSAISYLTMVGSSPGRRLEWFILSTVALVLALSEGIDMLALQVSDGWVHRYEVPRLTLIDRTIARVVESMTKVGEDEASPVLNPVRVIPLG